MPPAAQPLRASTKQTEVSVQLTPEAWGDQCWPPSSVCKITPRSPTAQPCCGFRNRDVAESGVVRLDVAGGRFVAGEVGEGYSGARILRFGLDDAGSFGVGVYGDWAIP